MESPLEDIRLPTFEDTPPHTLRYVNDSLRPILSDAQVISNQAHALLAKLSYVTGCFCKGDIKDFQYGYSIAKCETVAKEIDESLKDIATKLAEFVKTIPPCPAAPDAKD